jgi:hypothetical protein
MIAALTAVMTYINLLVGAVLSKTVLIRVNPSLKKRCKSHRILSRSFNESRRESQTKTGILKNSFTPFLQKSYSESIAYNFVDFLMNRAGRCNDGGPLIYYLRFMIY